MRHSISQLVSLLSHIMIWNADGLVNLRGIETQTGHGSIQAQRRFGDTSKMLQRRTI